MPNVPKTKATIRKRLNQVLGPAAWCDNPSCAKLSENYSWEPKNVEDELTVDPTQVVALCFRCAALRRAQTKKQSIGIAKIHPITGEVVATYPSISEAARIHGCTPTRMSEHLRLRHPRTSMYKGFRWKYLNDLDTEGPVGSE